MTLPTSKIHSSVLAILRLLLLDNLLMLLLSRSVQTIDPSLTQNSQDGKNEKQREDGEEVVENEEIHVGSLLQAAIGVRVDRVASQLIHSLDDKCDGSSDEEH